jgi:hypothetical protein
MLIIQVTDPTGKQLKTEFVPQHSSGFIEVLLTPENAGYIVDNLCASLIS